MVKIENVEVMGWEAAIRGMRNPMNSWAKSDSKMVWTEDPSYYDIGRPNLAMNISVGSNDLDLMKRLRSAGADHRKFMRMIAVYLDITAPLYWWKEFSTYKVGMVANSCSTMHKIADKEFTLEDFSHEQLNEKSLYMLNETVRYLNAVREAFIETKDKGYWWQMIQLLPSSYNQRRTIMLNYEVLVNIYKSRRNHKLDEWRELCAWIETLPYSELITGNETKERAKAALSIRERYAMYDAAESSGEGRPHAQ